MDPNASSVCFAPATEARDRQGAGAPPDRRPDRRTVLAAALGFAGLAAAPGIAGAGVAGCASVRPAAARYPATQALIDSYVGARKLSGAAVAIVRPGAPVAYLTAGARAFDGPATTPDTLYRIYSMTKPVTGVAAMLLIEDGRLSLDQPIADLLPAYRTMQVLVDPSGDEVRPAKRLITVRHLLTHTAGLSYAIRPESPLARRYAQEGLTPGDRTGRVPAGAKAQPATLAEFADRLAGVPLNADPGARWEYSVAQDLLGRVIEVASGMAFDRFLRQRIFDPLMMPDTAFDAPPGARDRLTSVYGVSPQGLSVIDDRADSPFATRPATLFAGGAGLVSTPQDYARFVGMLLGDGALGRVRIMSRETARLAMSNLLPEGVVYRPSKGFAAAMDIQLEQGVEPDEEAPGSVSWGGAAGTLMWADRASGLGLVLMTQYMPLRAYPLQDEIQKAAYRDLRGV